MRCIFHLKNIYSSVVSICIDPHSWVTPQSGHPTVGSPHSRVTPQSDYLGHPTVELPGSPHSQITRVTPQSDYQGHPTVGLPGSPQSVSNKSLTFIYRINDVHVDQCTNMWQLIKLIYEWTYINVSSSSSLNKKCTCGEVFIDRMLFLEASLSLLWEGLYDVLLLFTCKHPCSMQQQVLPVTIVFHQPYTVQQRSLSAYVLSDLYAIWTPFCMCLFAPDNIFVTCQMKVCISNLEMTLITLY